MTQYDKLKDILREMFQMDQADLDFGIYRIMNAKRSEIETFLDKELLPQVASEFAKYRGTEIEEKKKELGALEATLRDSGMNPDDAPKVKEIRERIAKYGDNDALANEVFSHLSSFFRRYYDNGDFLSLRRYKKDTYAIPYEGEEVKLHWANADQYYIKTSEFLRDYSFKLPNTDKKAHFKLVDATQEKDNIKTETGKERKFKLHEEEPIRIEGKEVFIQFVYLPEKEKQDNLNKKTIEILNVELTKKLKDFTEVFTPASTEKNPKRTLLEKHLYSYTARFNFDFFIHKDLGGFLRRELDFYVKNEVLFVDDLDAQDEKKLKSSIAKVKVIKHIAQKIIAFLAQLEDFQKKLWLKKKFVVSCGYCVTLDRVPAALYAEIVKNDAQREEWVKLFSVDEIHGDLIKATYSKPLTVGFLKANPYLVLDTKHFDEQFKEKLLVSFENLDEATDGVIINSENFQALNLLQEKYREQVKCIYIDPPYNTDATPIVYKNDYKDSSWLSLMNDRIQLGDLVILPKDGYFSLAIDDAELHNLFKLLETVSKKDIFQVIVNHYPGSGTGRSNVSKTHEYNIFVVPTGSDILRGKVKAGGERERGFCRSGTGDNNYRHGRPNSFYAVLVNSKTLAIVGFEKPPAMGENYPTEKTKEGYLRVYPLGEDGSERCWSLGYESALNYNQKKMLKCTKNFVIKRLYYDESDRELLPSVWIDKKYSAVVNGTNVLTDFFKQSGLFSFPKSVYTVQDAIGAGTFANEDALVLDYFAGSGTTAHAVINLNREDDGRRKYFLVEMGEYFDTVLKPRIQKVVYSKDWKDCKPVSREGISHMFKYMRLEGYDDTLDNLVVRRSANQNATLAIITPLAREDYTLSYLLDIETKASDSILNIDRFGDPFNYTLKIRKDNELKDQRIDLMETFNYLIGLYVQQTETIRGFKVVRGKLRTGEKTLVIWRNTKDKPNEALDEFFKKQKYNTLDFEFDLIFVNGDNNLENLKVAEDKWKVRLIEEEFKRHMFEQTGV